MLKSMIVIAIAAMSFQVQAQEITSGTVTTIGGCSVRLGRKLPVHKVQRAHQESIAVINDHERAENARRAAQPAQVVKVFVKEKYNPSELSDATYALRDANLAARAGRVSGERAKIKPAREKADAIHIANAKRAAEYWRSAATMSQNQWSLNEWAELNNERKGNMHRQSALSKKANRDPLGSMATSLQRMSGEW